MNLDWLFPWRRSDESPEKKSDAEIIDIKNLRSKVQEHGIVRAAAKVQELNSLAKVVDRRLTDHFSDRGRELELLVAQTLEKARR